MRTFSINTLGCKVNQYESRQIRQFLESLGLAAVHSPGSPDLAVINTCCVTHTASAKSRSYIQRAQKLAPDAVTVICGCLPALETPELSCHKSKNLHIVKDRRTLAETLHKLIDSLRQDPKMCPEHLIRPQNPRKIKDNNPAFANCPELPQLTAFKGHTRAFLKVQDGCDAGCSYCIIPKTRPHVHSKPADHVLSEAGSLVEAGHKEIVLTGVNLGAYGQPTVRRRNWQDGVNPHLAEILDELAQVPGLARIRLSSLEPADVTEGLLDIFAKRDNIMPHLHLSIQSASDRILRRMCRDYSANDLREKIAMIKAHLDRPAITADIIVGFPSETDEDFAETVALAKFAGFSKMHVFPFSPRTATPAAKMKERVPIPVVKQRSETLRNLSNELAGQFRDRFIGHTCNILTEGDNAHHHGRAERYFMVHIKPNGQKLEKNRIVKVKLVKNTDDGMAATACRESEVTK